MDDFRTPRAIGVCSRRVADVTSVSENDTIDTKQLATADVMRPR